MPAQALALHAALQLDLVAVQHGAPLLVLPAVVHVRRRPPAAALLNGEASQGLAVR